MIRLDKRALRPARAGHPWIFRSDVAEIPSSVRGGDLVPFAGPDGRALGVAAYSDTSAIALRVMPIRPDAPNFERAWLALVEDALDRRAKRPPTTRLINADADGLPGLVVDKYGDALSIQTLSQAAERRQEAVVERLAARFNPTAIALRNDVRVRELEGLPEEKRLLRGTDAKVLAPIGRLTLEFDLLDGQKTGGFLDQQDNRLAAAAFLSGTCLDCFCYDGGFSLQLAAAGHQPLAVDSSGHALARLQANAARNQLTVETHEANVFDYLRELEREGRRFDGIILDPPAFARSRQAVPAARRAYKEINLRAFKLLNPGGRLVTCTCSAHMTRPDFEALVAEAAADAHRYVRVIERRSAAVDHPTMLTAPETDYLKVLFLEAA